MYLKLIRPICEYADQVMQNKDDMLANNDSFDGCAGLEEIIPKGALYEYCKHLSS